LVNRGKEALVQASKQISPNVVCVVNEGSVSELNAAVRDFLRANATVEYAVKCSDGTTRRFDDVAGLKRYENSRRAAIIQLSISGRSDDAQRYVTVDLGKRYAWDTAASISVSGNGPAVESAVEKLQDILESMRPWYATLSRIDFVKILFLAWCLMVGLAFAYVAVYRRWGDVRWGESIFELRAVYPVLLTYCVAYSLNLLRSRIFPVCVFALGQGKRRHERAEYLRGGVVLAFLVGVAASAVVSIIAYFVVG
jgi:hypothetical protein